MKNVAIIGAGVAGYTAAIELSSHFRVTLFEKSLTGGTCVNRGCIPVKYFVYRRDQINEITKANQVLKNDLVPEIDMKKLQSDKNNKTEKIRKSINSNLKKSKIELVESNVTISGKKIITEVKTYEPDIIIVATGSIPVSHDIFDIEPKAPVSENSTKFLNIDKIPSTLAVIGGGYIGIELASIFSSFGSKVTVFERGDRILPGFEKASSKSLEFRLKRSGLKFIKNADVKKIHKTGALTYIDKNGNSIATESFEHVLISIGRNANTVQGLDVQTTDKNYIKVDNNFKTSADGIYAIGDIIGPPFFAHRASRQAMLLSWYLKGEDISDKDDSLIPEVVFTEPELAKIGLDEDELKQKGIEFKSYKIPYGVLGKSIILDENGQLKLLTDTNGKILGCIIIGKSSSELVGYMSIAIYKGMNINELKDITMPHPTLSELFLEIGLRY